jgi:coenzyme F420-0:L-glutamate ligase / coenzyme F420-1:gamma-L-glutamate ligase
MKMTHFLWESNRGVLAAAGGAVPILVAAVAPVAQCNLVPLGVNSRFAVMRKRVKHSSSTRKIPRAHAFLEIVAIPGLPEFAEGDDLTAEIVAAARRARIRFDDGDVLVIAQKIVSKVEGRLAQLSGVVPTSEAAQLGAQLSKDPRLIEVILRESRRVVRRDPVLIVETHHGFVCANAGVDQSNIPGSDVVSLLPRDPDRTARRLAAALRKLTGKRIAVIVSDTFGRPWRLGLINVAIGAAGVPALVDLRGTRDLHGNALHATIIAVADELATAAGLLMGKAAGIPAVIVRGYRYRFTVDPAARIIRPANEDLFR